MPKRSLQPALKLTSLTSELEVVFKDETATVLPTAGEWPADATTGAALLFDYDGDGDLDLPKSREPPTRLARNDGGKFTDVTAQAGALEDHRRIRYRSHRRRLRQRQPPRSLHSSPGREHALPQRRQRKFSDVTAARKIATPANLSSSAAFVDSITTAIRPPDLGDGYLLLRNNGDGTFSDQTAAAKLADKVAARAIVPTDFDNRRDIDLLVASTEKISLWRNMRDGTFRDVD